MEMQLGFQNQNYFFNQPAQQEHL